MRRNIHREAVYTTLPNVRRSIISRALMSDCATCLRQSKEYEEMPTMKARRQSPSASLSNIRTPSITSTSTHDLAIVRLDFDIASSPFPPPRPQSPQCTCWKYPHCSYQGVTPSLADSEHRANLSKGAQVCLLRVVDSVSGRRIGNARISIFTPCFLYRDAKHQHLFLPHAVERCNRQIATGSISHNIKIDILGRHPQTLQ